MYQIATKTRELATKFLVLSHQEQLDFSFNFEPWTELRSNYYKGQSIRGMCYVYVHELCEWNVL